MPLRRHWAHFRCHDWSFTGSEAVDFLHELLRCNSNFGPEVTRYQTLQLLRKFLKAHVVEDIKGRHGTENFEDNGQLYRRGLTLGSASAASVQNTDSSYKLLITQNTSAALLTFSRQRLMSNFCLNSLL